MYWKWNSTSIEMACKLILYWQARTFKKKLLNILSLFQLVCLVLYLPINNNLEPNKSIFLFKEQR